VKRSVAIARLKQHETEFKQRGVDRLYLFGSTARDEAKDDSDVDLFFDHERGQLGLFQLMDVKEFASKILGCGAEIMTCASLHPVLQERIEASALRVL
jgi:predicted nucleotidyltransferase